MTTFSYSLTIGDSQYISLEAALNHMIKHCDEQMAIEPRAPFGAHARSCRQMLEQLRTCDRRMTSYYDYEKQEVNVFLPGREPGSDKP